MNQETNQPEKQEETPRQKLVKHVLAWLGIIYVLLTMLLTWVYLIRGDWLYSIGPLLTIPALLGFGVFQYLRYRTEKGNVLFLLLIELLVLVATGYALYAGIPMLLAQL